MEGAQQLSLRGFLNRRLRIVLSDGRVVDGNFLCTDRDCNIVIGDCEEFLCQKDVGEDEIKVAIVTLLLPPQIANSCLYP